jgi:hypothetical protein
MPVLTLIQNRRGLAAAWTAANSILAVGEIGYESDTRRHKLGDGVTSWNSLPYTDSTGPRDVRWYGAYGDWPTHDDGAAIDAAIADLPSSGGTLYLSPAADGSPGRYGTAGHFTIPVNQTNVRFLGAQSAYPGDPPSSLVGEIQVNNGANNLCFSSMSLVGGAKSVRVLNGTTIGSLVFDHVAFLDHTDKAVSVDAGAVLVGVAFRACVFYHVKHGFYSAFGATTNNVHFDNDCTWWNERDGGYQVYVGGDMAGSEGCTNITVAGLMNGTATTTCIPIALGRCGVVDLTHLHFADWGDAAVTPSGLPLILLLDDTAGGGVSSLRVAGELSNARGPAIKYDPAVTSAGLLDVSGKLQAAGAFPPIENLGVVGSLVSTANYAGGRQMQTPGVGNWISTQDNSCVGPIDCVSGASLVNHETFTRNDGVHAIKVFEFLSSGVVTPGNIAVAFTAGDTVATIRDAIITAINGVGAGLAQLASIGSATTVRVDSTTSVRTAFDVPQPDTVAAAGFVCATMTGCLPAGAQRVLKSLVPVVLTAGGPLALGYSDLNRLFILNAPGATLTVTMPVASGARSASIGFKLVAGTMIRIDRASSDLLEGNLGNYYLFHAGDYVEFISDGSAGDGAHTNWHADRAVQAFQMRGSGTEAAATTDYISAFSQPSDAYGTSVAQRVSGLQVLGDRIRQSRLPAASDLLLVTDTGYWVYMGQAPCAYTIKFIEFYVTIAGVGAQTAEVAVLTSPGPPNKGNLVLTKLVANATLDDLTTTGVKRNTAAMATACVSGTHIWVGIRTAMAATQPTLAALGMDMAQGQILLTATPGSLAGAGPWTGAIIAASTVGQCPALRAVMD